MARPDVYLDVRIGTPLKQSILDVLGTVDESGNGALSADALNNPIPGLGKSVTELLNVARDGQGNVTAFQLKAAAEEYLDGFGYTGKDFPSLRGLTDVLTRLFTRDFSIPFNTSRLDWSGFDFSGYDFRGFGFDALRNFNFSGANLSWADFRGLDLSGIDFSGANLSFALFDGFNILRGVNFGGANLTGINWSGIDLRWLDFSGANLSGDEFLRHGPVGDQPAMG